MSTEDRFWSKVDVPYGGEGCWEWTAARCNGYGWFRADGGRNQYASRYAYTLLIGPIPEGLEIDHLCRNRGCVNPEHLEAVSKAENIRRGESPSAQARRQTHCVNGHRLDGDNLQRRMTPKGERRVCVTCNRAGAARQRERARSW